jgi:hypothetical protein
MAALVAVLLATGCSPDADDAAPPDRSTTSVVSASVDSTSTPVSTAPLDHGFVPIASDPDLSPEGQPLPPTCEGGPLLLDAPIDGGSIIVHESPDGRYFCIVDPTYGTVPVFVTEGFPAVDTPMIETFGDYGRALIHVRVPAEFPTEITVRDTDGNELLVARGQASDILVVIDPRPGSSMRDRRTLEFVDDAGAVLATLRHLGMPDPDQPRQDFFACIRAAGVDFPEPSPSNTGPLVVDAPVEVFRTAWVACREVWFGEQEMFNPPEYVDELRHEMNCLADSGYFPLVGQPIDDQAGYEAASIECRLTSPAVTALTACLVDHGLDIVVAGVPVAGPWDERLAAPWNACRDDFAVAELGSANSISVMMPRLDCMAEQGWLTPLVNQRPYTDPGLITADFMCKAVAVPSDPEGGTAPPGAPPEFGLLRTDVAAFDVASGSLVWTRELFADPSVLDARAGQAGAVTFTIVTRERPCFGIAYELSLDIETSEHLESRPFELEEYATQTFPRTLTSAGGVDYVLQLQQDVPTLSAIETATGAIRWAVSYPDPAGQLLRVRSYAAAVVIDDVLYVGASSDSTDISRCAGD